MPFNRRTDLEINELECIWLEINFPNRNSFIVSVWCRPLSTSKFLPKSFSKLFCNSLIKLSSESRVHLREHKFKNNFQDCLNAICNCGLNIESTSHFLLRCPTFNDERYTPLSTLNNIDYKLLELTKSSLLQTLLYGNTLFNKEKKTRILNATIEYISSSERFEEPFI